MLLSYDSNYHYYNLSLNYYYPFLRTVNNHQMQRIIQRKEE